MKRGAPFLPGGRSVLADHHFDAKSDARTTVEEQSFSAALHGAKEQGFRPR